MLLQSN